jgi:N-acetylmuramoyl-L-alanine amidase
MVPALFKKSELKVRHEILRGVYRDNLRIMGRGRYRRKRDRFFRLKRILLTCLVFLATVLVNGNYLVDLLSPARSITASVLVGRSHAKLTAESPQSPTDLSDYTAFMNTGVPIGRVFGLGVKSIMIDPGHGGSDSGTVGALGTREKDLTLDIAQRLRKRLLRYGFFNVILTRDDDQTVPLSKRVDLAVSSKADLFISIHLNYLPYNPGNIIETYYFGPTADKKALELTRQENAGSEYGLSDFKEIIEKLGETVKFQESRDFAMAIQRNLFLNSRKQNGAIQDFGVKRAPFVVLLGVDVPAVLAEVSCLSNKQEEMELSTHAHRDGIAAYLEAGILDYLHNRGDVIYDTARTASAR